ncbi:hypothetical protein CcCBS67573_g04728 [Chytriomyces confervae]|uniref:PHD-type domain-containing protein n=1 Tax=Chytriomyces confervae TaxID=246404 RepID=A0A507FE18_9FUNG|nr:hypothetical protein CcCBS67573_g04728 [Chytriomyces confervae]
MGSVNPIIPGHSVVPFVPLAAQTSLFATPGAPASASAAAAAAATASSATPNAPPASKFLVQRSPSMTSAADILQTATEMAAAVVVESKAADAISGGGLSGGRPRGNTPDRNGNTTPKPNNPKRPLSSSFGVGALHPSISSPFLTTPTNMHGHHVLGVSGIPGSLGATMGAGLSPNKKRLKRKFEEGGSVGNSRHSGANSSSNAQSSSAAANGGGTDADEEVYCICQSVSYGEMIGCDSPECEKEWFHLACVGLKAPPDGVWLCPECVRLKAAAAAAALSASSGMGGAGDDLDDDDDDLDADDGSVKKSVFATAVTPLAATAVSASAASHHKKKRVR